MAEQWIPAAKALELLNNETRLTSALRSGILKANGALINSSDIDTAKNPIPLKFWENDRYHEFHADWQNDYFSNVIDGTIEMYVWGLTIELSGLLQMLPAEERGLIARGFSVAGDPDWLPAIDARRLCYSIVNPTNAALWLLEQARLGFVTARTVKAEMKRAAYDNHCVWSEREWDIPVWFWENFTKISSSRQNWETGQFSGNGHGPRGSGELILNGVHFHATTLRRLTGQADDTPVEAPASIEGQDKKGRKPSYDWNAATSAIWGSIHRGEFKPELQADVELALIKHLQRGDKEPAESSVRPYAKYIFDEYQKP
ncbi:MAG: hypothetical protein B7Y89_12965 [Novosphingobium sp. 32-60-15]|uniref:hypothetical protein n=1 Tax=Novosphingobium sp. 32-60-15 TaxID=1970410 RepID=UPI000BD74EAB|nr:hypothetical protein [Novosphingobium sp. 32-60-15]OYX61346.1 MAG: hypothetical protein B7Y89_12965 [Novosphingobium sp. 32-60-15]